jgi:hypothetical protein
MIRRSLFRQPMKYQIITCERVVVGIRDDTVVGRFRGRSTCHPEEGKPEPERV